ncbi:MAG: sigma-70 family RNA polymerase sigma factor [Acidobacteriia bacterium]|nr:sigma-70 family RNA polymerase sigma factor [Terriglobia bacterium]
MRDLAYSLIYETDPPRICESVRVGYDPSRVHSVCWTEEELGRIRLVLRKLTALRVGNPEDAEDLVQDTLLTMVRKAPEIDLEKGMLIWAMGILRRKVGNYYRRAQRFTSLDEQVRHSVRCSSVVPSPEAILHHAELCAMIDAILSRLPPQEREAIDLFLAGRQTGEIVSLLRPERYQNIVNRVHRGRKKLAKELARFGYARHASKKQH